MTLLLVACTVRGCVQGVFFRASTEREAKRLGLSGWVKNRDDGGVEICAEGEEARLKELVEWAHHGPSAAKVEHVEVRWRPFSGELSEFGVVR